LDWEEEQERLTLGARLLASSPEAVFEELKKLSVQARAKHFNDDKYEVNLVSRNERLINLGLAAFGTNQEVLKALYKHGLEPAHDSSDASYKEGLRIGCLSNNTVVEAHLIFNFPDDIVGREETRRVLTEVDDNEITALLQNPKVSEELLEALYSRKDVFAELPEQQWLRLIYISASNARLVTEYDYSDMPDSDYYSIHKAIFGLLGTAPVNYHWLRALYHLLDQLDFQNVHLPGRIDQVLARWSQLPTSDKKDNLGEGYYTSLPIKDEFRCFIAALYGRGFANNDIILHGRPDATDIALRCAYYGRGNLTAKDMEAGHKKDEDVFTFAAILNTRTHQFRDLRRLMEEEYLGDDMTHRWLRYDEQLRKKWPDSIPSALRELATEIAPKPVDTVQSSIKELQKGLTTLTTRVSELRALVIFSAIMLAILIYILSK
jgi:hypothetical protein